MENKRMVTKKTVSFSPDVSYDNTPTDRDVVNKMSGKDAWYSECKLRLNDHNLNLFCGTLITVKIMHRRLDQCVNLGFKQIYLQFYVDDVTGLYIKKN